MSEQISSVQSSPDPESLETLAQISGELRKLSASPSGASPADFRVRRLYRQASIVSSDEPVEIESFLTNWLLKDCSEHSDPDTDDQRMQRYALRDVLRDWLDTLPENMLWLIRPKAIQYVSEVVRANPSEDRLYTLTAIGYRDHLTTTTLRSVSSRDDTLADLAIRLMIGMGLDDVDVDWIRSRIGLRVAAGQPSIELLRAITKLADPSALTTLSTAASTASDWSTFSHLGWLCDHAPGDTSLQASVWAAMVVVANSRPNGWRELLLMGDAIGRCHSSQVIETLTEKLSMIVKSGGLHLLGARVNGITSPTQAAVLAKRKAAPDVDSLHETAIKSSGPTARWTTAEGHAKEQAWKIALFLGSQEPIQWIDDAVNNESNLFQQHNLMELLAVLSLRRLPAATVTLLRRPLAFERGNENPDLLPYLGATRLAASSQSVESLQLLLQSSGTMNGAPFRAPVDDSADLAVWLYRRGEPDIVDLLTRSLTSLTPMAQNGAARGLRWIAGSGANTVFPGETIAALSAVAFDDSKEPYLRIDAIAAIALSQDATSQAFCDRMVELCVHGNEILRFTAACALLQAHKFTRYREAITSAAFRNTGRDRVKGGHLSETITDQEAFLIGQITAYAPDDFATEMVTVIKKSFTVALSENLRGFITVWPKDKIVPLTITDAIVARIQVEESVESAEMFLFQYLAEICQERLLEERWEQLWDTWMPDSRQALADAIPVGSSRFPPRLMDRACETLIRLLNDGVFAVRRAAARSLSQINSPVLQITCREWASSGSIALRLHAAEAAAWFPDHDRVTLNNEFIRELQRDQERQVRDAAGRSQVELRRRIWAAEHYLAVTKSTESDPNSWVLKNYAHGTALANLGDDMDFRNLNSFSREAHLPPNVQHWIKMLAKEMEKNWKETTRKWPQPWLPWRGSLEQVHAELLIEGKPYSANVTLWLLPPEDANSWPSWGGAATLKDVRPFVLFQMTMAGNAELFTIRIDGRKTASALIVGMHGAELTFSGSDIYPR